MKTMKFVAGSIFLLSVCTSVTNAISQPRAVVLTGQPAPGTNGGVIASVSRPSLNRLGNIAFHSDVTGSTVLNGIFLARSGAVSRIALFGELAPNGVPFRNFGLPALNDGGQVAFMARLGTGFENQGVFLYSGTGTSTITLTGRNAPGTSGTFGVFGRAGILLNNAGKIAFDATVKGSTVANGIFEYVAGVSRSVALEGQPAPGTGGGKFSRFHGLDMNQTGQIAFLATITGAAAGNGIFLATNGTVRAVTVEGQLAPYVGGGSFQVLRDLSINDVGEVTFVDTTKSGGRFGSPSLPKGVFLYSSGAISLVTATNWQRRPGEPIPTGNFHRPSVVRTANGNRILLAAWNQIRGRNALLGWSENGLTQLLQQGDPSPAGGVYSFIGNQVVAGSGHFAFVSNLQGSSAKAGIFLDTISF